jgi:RimJ/RimL family protein N-acetyltransferase
LAVTYPRSIDAFEVHWKNVFSDPKVIVKGITFGDAPIGHISCFKIDELDVVGYWIAREFWGKGIAAYALEMLLKMVTIRP